MSEPVSALGHAAFVGFATVREIGPLGMITLRAKADAPGLAQAVRTAVGLEMPAPRRIVRAADLAIGWMAPDEWLLVLPYAEVGQTLDRLHGSLGDVHHLAVDVSDARAVFRLEGDKAAEVLMKLTPADLAALAPDELRRSRAAQVACAFWADEGGFTLVSFRSVAGYVIALLTHSAQPGSELGLV